MGDVKPTYGVRTKKRGANDVTSFRRGKVKINEDSGDELQQDVSLMEPSIDKVPGPRVQDRLGKVSEIHYTDEGENKTFRTQQSMMSIHQKKEAVNWGKSQNGYLGGGNYEDNPDLNQLSIRRY